MGMIGALDKMTASLSDDGTTAEYQLVVGDRQLPLNPLIGKRLQLRFTGQINCIACGRKIKKTFSQGHCFPCVRKLASCDMCILKPELCHFDQGTCREPEWGQRWCMDTHFVYLSNTSALKVGITRHSNIPSRWIDQGAVQAMPIYRVASRQISGLLETAIAQTMQDKTNWRAMLKASPDDIDLAAKAQSVCAAIAPAAGELEQRFGEGSVQQLHDQSVVRINYPVQHYPQKITSLNFDKVAEIDAVLTGIKAQYLIFDTGVINIRKFTGYEVAVVTGD